MAIHVRISNNNVLKLLKLRLMPYATQVHGEYNLDKICQRLSNEELTESDICDGGMQHNRDTHLYMKNVELHSPSDFTCKHVNIDICTEHRLRGNPHSSRSTHCDICSQKAVLPMSLLDVQKIFFCSDALRSLRFRNQYDRLDDIFKPIRHTSDDILSFVRPETKHSVTHTRDHVVVVDDASANKTYMTESTCSQDNVVFCDGNTSKTDQTKKSDKSPLPSEEQLRIVHEYFVNYLPQFFKVKLDFSLCHKDIVFENNYWGNNKVICGISAYASELNKIRFIALLKYTRVDMRILKITIHTEDGTVRVRWRICGVPQFRSLFVWKHLFHKGKESDNVWHDGFSVFHVGKDGLIHKHKVDRVMPDEEREYTKSTSVATKLAILLGLSPKPALSDFSSLFMKKSALTAK